jgi:hypothetical protein
MGNSVDIEAYYNTHLPVAEALPDARVLTTRVDPDLAIVNIETAMHVFIDQKVAILLHFPKVDVPLLEALPELALALKYAALRAEQAVPAESQMAAKSSEARGLRAKLLSAAKALAENGLIPQAEVAAIVAGTGSRDRAEDCVALAALFRNHAAAIAGKHPITVDLIDQAAAVGSWLLANMRPADAPNAPSLGPSPEVDIRNRFATLLIIGHQKLQAIAHYFYPTDWEERVPALGSRKVSRKKPDAAPAPQTP